MSIAAVTPLITPFRLLLIGLAIIAVTSTSALAQPEENRVIPFYIGTYTGGASEGIYRSELNLQSGAMAEPKLVAELDNPSFLTIHPNLDVLYAVSEVRRGGKRENSQVMAYRILDDGMLESLGGKPAGGDGPCYVSTDDAGEFAFVANYGSGSVSAFRITENGSLGEMTCNIQHTGSSTNPRRQQGPHAHCIMTDPTDRFVCAVDLGMDEVVVYKLDRDTGKLIPTGQPLEVTPGNGPRHMAFHPNGKLAFVIHEMASKLSACAWDSNTGQLRTLQTLSTLPDGFDGGNSTAEVLVHPNGNFVYGSNRGHDSIAIFTLNTQSGELTLVDHTSSGGETPRNFRIDPTGQYLLTENQNSDTIFSFEVDSESGKLTSVGGPITLGSPCCIKFFVR